MTEREKLAAELERQALMVEEFSSDADAAYWLRRAAAMLRETWQPIETAPPMRTLTRF